MKMLLTLAVALCLIPTAARAELKAGYVDLQRALSEVGEGKLAREKLKVEMERKKGELDGEQTKLKVEKDVLDKQSSMMSEDSRVQKYGELQQKLIVLAQKAEKMQGEMQQAEQKELKRIFEKMDPIIASIAQREGLTFVFEKTDSGLVYAPASLDLTNELVRTYNDKNPVKGALPATPVNIKGPQGTGPATSPAPGAPAAPKK